MRSSLIPTGGGTLLITLTSYSHKVCPTLSEKLLFECNSRVTRVCV